MFVATFGLWHIRFATHQYRILDYVIYTRMFKHIRYIIYIVYVRDIILYIRVNPRYIDFFSKFIH